MKFRKRPVTIEARQFPGLQHPPAWKGQFDEVLEFEDWLTCHGVKGKYRDGGLYIQTLEGEMRADPGDWIIRGIKGEFYPCKPDIFEATYERVE